MKKNDLVFRFRNVFQFATCAVIMLGVGLLTLTLTSQTVVAQRFLDLSAIANYLPKSLREAYPSPMLADDDVLFAIDSTGKSLYLNFASSRTSSVVVVVDPARGKDSALVWHSGAIEGKINYCYAADINGDDLQEIVVSTRNMENRAWHRVHIWNWPADANPDSVKALAPCSDTVNSYFQAMTLVEVIDTGAAPDGISEVVVMSIIGGIAGREPTTIRTVYYWTGEEYCVSRSGK